MYYPSSLDLKLLRQTSKLYSYKFELFDHDVLLTTLESDIVSGSVNIDSSSDIRRTLDCSFIVKQKSDLSTYLSLGNSLKFSIGQYDYRNDQYVYYTVGLFAFSNKSYSFDESTNSLSLSCVDYMTTVINAPIRNVSKLMVEYGTSIRESIIAYVRDIAGVKYYSVDDVSPLYDLTANTVPYEIEYSVGTSCYDVIKELRDLYSGWETFFDLDVFICQRIPSCSVDEPMIDDDILQHTVISENGSTDFDSVKNITEVWGMSFEVEWYTKVCSYSNNTYNVTVDSFTGLVSGHKIAVHISNENLANSNMVINGTDYGMLYQYTYNKDNIEDNLEAGRLQPNQTYVFEYSNKKLFYLGQYQVHAITALVEKEPGEQEKKENMTKWNCNAINYVVNPHSPYTIEKIGERWNVLSDGIYAKIYSDDLALERADYENWLTCRLNDSLTLEMLLIPWLDVNRKIRYTSRQSGETNYYVVKSINYEITSGTMSVTLSRFYEEWSDIVASKKEC